MLSSKKFRSEAPIFMGVPTFMTTWEGEGKGKGSSDIFKTVSGKLGPNDKNVPAWWWLARCFKNIRR